MAPHMKCLVPHAINFALWATTPRARGCNFWGVRGCMAHKTLWCCGNASLPEQRSALRDIYPLYSPKQYIGLLGGLLPVNLTCRHKMQYLMWGIGGPFLPAMAMVRWSLCVFCSVPEHEPFLSSGTTAYGYRQKAFVSSKTMLVLYWGGEVELKEIPTLEC